MDIAFKAGQRVRTINGHRGVVVDSIINNGSSFYPDLEITMVRWDEDGAITRVCDSPRLLRILGPLDLLAEV